MFELIDINIIMVFFLIYVCLILTCYFIDICNKYIIRDIHKSPVLLPTYNEKKMYKHLQELEQI